MNERTPTSWSQSIDWSHWTWIHTVIAVGVAGLLLIVFLAFRSIDFDEIPNSEEAMAVFLTKARAAAEAPADANAQGALLAFRTDDQTKETVGTAYSYLPKLRAFAQADGVPEMRIPAAISVPGLADSLPLGVFISRSGTMTGIAAGDFTAPAMKDLVNQLPCATSVTVHFAYKKRTDDLPLSCGNSMLTLHQH